MWVSGMSWDSVPDPGIFGGMDSDVPGGEGPERAPRQTIGQPYPAAARRGAACADDLNWADAPEAIKRPGRVFRLAATRHGRAFFFACPPGRRTRRTTGWSLSTARPDRLCPPARIWPQACAAWVSGASETRNPMLLFSFVGLSRSTLCLRVLVVESTPACHSG